MFNSKDYKEPSIGGGSKVLTPGTYYVRIVNAVLERPSYADAGTMSYFVKLTLEGVDEGPEFEGFEIDKTNPSLGKYRGKIANVNSKRYPFSDYFYNGKPIQASTQIFNWLNSLASQWGVLEEMNKKNVTGETIEEYFENMKPYILNPDIWGHVIIGGKEYYKDNSEYPSYNLFFPSIDYKNKLYPFACSSNIEEIGKNFTSFSEENHVIKAEKPNLNSNLGEELDNFEEDEDAIFNTSQDVNSLLDD